jgi:hypothetical protein
MKPRRKAMSNEQIEEMSRHIQNAVGGCSTYWSRLISEALYDAGYRKRSEWISVEERLPDHCGLPVLMVAVNSYNQIRVVKGFTDYQCPITFHTNEREYDSVWAAWEVTHWMPLPELPKMKEVRDESQN